MPINVHVKQYVMITCFLKYTIDPYQLDKFEWYAKSWIDLVNDMGGIHHGYLMPHEGTNNIAYASFSFDSMADYEVYRAKFPTCEKCQETHVHAEKYRYIIKYERSFMRPVFDGLAQ